MHFLHVNKTLNKHETHYYMLQIVFMVYMIMVTLLLVNMLIAMMGNTYQLVAETQKEWFRQVSGGWFKQLNDSDR